MMCGSVKNALYLEKYQIKDLLEYCDLEFQKSLKENAVVYFCLWLNILKMKIPEFWIWKTAMSS
jgi:hypothetical protein